MKFVTIILIMSLSGVEAPANSSPGSDTTETGKPPKPYNVRLTTRIHNMGVFYYSGRVVSKNPALDFLFLYERKGWGFTFYKAFDLRDHLSDNDFSLALFYKSFHFGKRLTITPHVGFVMDQNHSLADPTSDAAVIIITAFRISKHFTVDNSSFFSNLLLNPDTKDWVNRYRILYTSPHLDFTLFAWHNNRVFDNNDYFSTGVNITYARMKISKNLLLSTGVSALAMLHTSDEVLYPKRNGVILTLGLVVD